MEEIQEEEAALKEFQDDEAALREVQVDDAALQKFLDEKAALQQAQHEALYSHPNDLPDDLPDDLLDDLPDNHPGDLPHDFPGNQLGDQPGDSPENQPGGPALPTNQRRKRANSPKSRRMRRKIRVVHSDNSVEYIWQEYIWNDENSDWAIYDGPGSNASENSNNIAELNTIERQGQQPPRLRRLNDALITRLLTSQRGSRTEKILQASDCIKALTIDNPQLHLEETYKPLGLEVNEATGLLAICSGESTTPILSALSKRSQEIQTFAGRNVSPLEREPIPKPIPQLPNEVSTSEENDSSDIECVDDPAASEVVESEPVEAEQETSKLNQWEAAFEELARGKRRAWFTAAYRPYKKKDALGHYRFARQAVWPEVSLKERLGDEKFSSDILDFLFSPSVIGENWDCQSALKAWAERGSVNIPLFKLSQNRSTKRLVGTCTKREEKDGPVTRIETPMNWEPAPCQQGDARLTMPQIPHGALPRYPNMKPRRCIFTWLTRINSDQATLASTEAGAGTAQDIALARIACTRPKTTPAGKHINNSKLPYKFPACVRLASLGAISDALIGLRQWDAPEVIAEQEILFGNDKAKALHHKFFDSYIVKTKVCIEKKPATHTQATKNKIGSYIGPKHEGSDLFILKDEEFVVYGLGCAADSDENMLGDGRFGLEMVMAKVTGTETDAISPRKRVFSTTTSSRFLVFCDWDEAPS
ncbi:hypothetical protein H4I96_12385 [Botrytis cinerea]